jgi:hypothetical protein
MQLRWYMAVLALDYHPEVRWDTVKYMQQLDRSPRRSDNKGRRSKLHWDRLDWWTRGAVTEQLFLTATATNRVTRWRQGWRRTDTALEKRPAGKRRIDAVAMDVPAADCEVFWAFLAEATIAFDHLHVVMLINCKVS